MEREEAFILGGGLGLMALPKTNIQLSRPTGFTEMLMWYNISNLGVTNIPSKYLINNCEMIKGTAIIGFLIFSLIGTISCNISAGSYAYAESYNLKVTESDLVSIIQEFKKDNPDYCVPDEVQLNDGRHDKNDHWYHMYFYYKEENTIVYTWIRQFDSETTEFAFVALNKGLSLGNWKDINKDFSRKENKLEKAKFEQRILNRIKLKIK